jgi:hypothetical protein
MPKWGSILKVIGVGAARAVPVIAPALGGPLAPAIGAAIPIIGELIHGAVSKAQEEMPESGRGPERLEAAFARAEVPLRILLTIWDAMSPRAINVAGAMVDFKEAISLYARLTKNLGLRESLPAAGLGAGVDGVAAQQPGAQPPQA